MTAAEGFDRDRDPLEFGRIVSLSDNVFGVALTLLVISIAVQPGLPRGELAGAIVSLLPRFVITAVSIGVVASAWYSHHRLFSMIQRANRGLISVNIVHLALIAVIPFPHAVLGDYAYEPVAYILLAAILAGANAMESALLLYAERRRLLRPGVSRETVALELRRHLLVIGGFVASIPLAFVLVGYTPLVWFALLPLEHLVRRRRAPTASAVADAQDP